MMKKATPKNFMIKCYTPFCVTGPATSLVLSSATVRVRRLSGGSDRESTLAPLTRRL